MTGITEFAGMLFRGIDTVTRIPREFSRSTKLYLFSALLQSAGGMMAGVVFVLYLKEIGVRESALGVVEGTAALTAAFVSLLAPAIVAAIGYRRLLIGAVALLALARVGQAAVPMMSALVGGAAALGIGDGLLRAMNTSYLAENSTEGQRTHVFTIEFQIRMIAIAIGGVVGGFAPGYLGAGTTGIQNTIYAGMGLVLLGLVPLAFTQSDGPRVPLYIRVFVDEIRHFDRWMHVGKLLISQGWIAVASGMTLPFVGLYLMHTLGASVQQIGLIQGLGSAVLAVTVIFTPLIRKWLGAAGGTFAIQSAAVPLLAAVPFVGTLAVGVPMLLARGTLMQVAGPLCNEFSMEGLSGKQKLMVNGLYFFALNMLGFAGRLIGGWMMETSYTAPYVTASWLFGIAGVFTMLFWIAPSAGWMPARARALVPAYVKSDR